MIHWGQNFRMQLPRPHPNKLKFLFLLAVLGLFIYVIIPQNGVSFKLIHSKNVFPYGVWSKQEHRNRELHNGDFEILDVTVSTEQDFAKRYTDASHIFVDDFAKNIPKHTHDNDKMATNEVRNDHKDKHKGEKLIFEKTKQEKLKITNVANASQKHQDESMKNMGHNTTSSNRSLDSGQSTKIEPKNVDPYRHKSLLEMSREDDLNTISNLEELKSKHTICTINRYKGHLGNRLFMFASGYGIAKANNMTFVIAQNIVLRSYFKLTVPFVKEPRPGALFPQQVHGGDGKFSKKLLHLKAEHTEVSGYLQSFKYFHPYRNELLKELTFVQPTLDYVKDFLTPIRKTCPGGCTLIGVQIRRGNILTQQNKDDGHRAANVTFFNKAMDYFSHKYKNVRFIICTNEQGWVKQNFINETNTFYLSGYRNPEDRDLAVLANCDHTIMASSTYGWWGAYLAGGDVVYYNGHPHPGSKLAKQYNLEDFYFDSWVPMSD